MTPPTDPTTNDELALILGGGGARGAYQVGFLRFLARARPNLEIPILTGVSAGAINAAHLANHQGPFATKVEDLVRLWSDLSVDQVFRVDTLSLMGHMWRWAFQLTFLGGRKHVSKVHGLVDTEPLAETLARALDAKDGDLDGIERNLARGTLRAVALATTRYATGQTITWCQGRDFTGWERPMRRSKRARLRVEHVMASAALPAIFPAVRVGNAWYGDGGIRLHAPLAPAIHLGANRLIAISTRHGKNHQQAEVPRIEGYPPPAQVLGVLLNAIFLDMLDQDAMNLERLNHLLSHVPESERGPLRPVHSLVLRPSCDLGELANDYEARLPGFFRFLTRRLGTGETKSQDLLSLVMFQPDYLRRLIEMGETDAEARADEVLAFVDGAAAEAGGASRARPAERVTGGSRPRPRKGARNERRRGAARAVRVRIVRARRDPIPGAP